MRNLWQSLIANLGPAELHFWSGLLLIAAGFCCVWPPGALLVPGFTLLWTGLPPRVIERAPPRIEPVKRTTR